jgi:ketosteroid isomerase-like protein
MRMTLAALLIFAGCTTTTPVAIDPAPINRVLDDFHKAASEADEDRYFSHFTADAVFMGTDATERWDVPTFRAYAHPFFVEDKGWTFTPRSRNVMTHGDVAWFDEVLDSASYGECRGTGVLRREGGKWRIAQYNLTIPMPNALATEFVQKIRDHAKP